MDEKKYICKYPFQDLSIYNEIEQYFCCKEWLNVPINFENGWNGEMAKRVREDMLLGKFTFCSTTNCPHLSTFKKIGYLSEFSPIIPLDEFNKNYEYNEYGPINVRFTFDSACNLSCPSCRHDFIPNSKNIEVKSDIILDKIYKYYGSTIEAVTLSGYGDPFYSKTMMKFLSEVDSVKLPKLNKIHLHTNAILWNEKTWKKIEKSIKYIKSAEISIDAATEDTYKKVRRGGNWGSLMKNLDFVNSIDTITDIIISFVIQTDNYFEIEKFYDFFSEKLKNKKLMFQYHSIQDWGVMNSNDYSNAKIWDKSHPLNSKLLIEIEKLKNKNDNRIVISLE